MANSKISNLKAVEIMDSKGHPTLQVTVTLENGTQGVGATPSGASTGKTEAVELRDGDQSRHQGKGVLKAVEIVNTTIKDLLIGQDVTDQKAVDSLMIEADGTPYKSKLGGNSITGVSIAIARAAAKALNISLFEHFGQLSTNSNFTLPTPMILVMEGGKHGDWATDIQEFMIMPQDASFPTFAEKFEVGKKIFKRLRIILDDKGYDTEVGFEGAFAPPQLSSNEEALELISQAIEAESLETGKDVKLALDVAASEFFSDGNYLLKSERGQSLSPAQWQEKIINWANQYHIWSIEDPFDQNSWQDWSDLTAKFGSDHQIVGDDLITTNEKLIQQAIDQKAINASLIKINQIGTISETLEAIKLSQEAGFESIISHRAGETNDNTIADLVVGTTATQCKFGGPEREERLAKYNRLLEIETEL